MTYLISANVFERCHVAVMSYATVFALPLFHFRAGNLNDVKGVTICLICNVFVLLITVLCFLPCLSLTKISLFTGSMRLVKELLNWGTKSEIKSQILRGIKEIGSVIYWMGLLDIVLVGILTFCAECWII